MGKEARVVVITGSGSAFCSGQDLGDRKSVSQIDLERTLRDEYEPMLRSILDCPVPTIAAINGAAAGAGANLALAADVVIACEVGLLFAGVHKNWFNSRCWWYLYNAKNNGKSQSNGCIIICR